MNNMKELKMKHGENLKNEKSERLKKLKKYIEEQRTLIKLEMIREAAKKEGTDAQMQHEMAKHLILSALTKKALDDLRDPLNKI